MSAEPEGPILVDPRELRTAAPFSTLFAIRPDDLKAITARMKADGFHASHPIEVWLEKNVVIDGHTRLQAAKNARLKDVMVCFLSFADEGSALDYAIKNQQYRRNLTEAELLRCIRAIHQTKEKGGDRGNQYTGGKPGKASKTGDGETDGLAIPPDEGIAKPRERSAQATADLLGTSRSKVERGLVVLSDPEATAAVERGEKSINAASNEVARKKREARPRTPKPEPMPEPVAEPEPVPVVAFEKPAPKPTVPAKPDATAALAEVDAVISRHLNQLDDFDVITFIVGLMELADRLRNEYGVETKEVTFGI